MCRLVFTISRTPPHGGLFLCICYVVSPQANKHLKYERWIRIARNNVPPRLPPRRKEIGKTRRPPSIRISVREDELYRKIQTITRY